MHYPRLLTLSCALVSMLTHAETRYAPEDPVLRAQLTARYTSFQRPELSAASQMMGYYHSVVVVPEQVCLAAQAPIPNYLNYAQAQYQHHYRYAYQLIAEHFGKESVESGNIAKIQKRNDLITTDRFQEQAYAQGMTVAALCRSMDKNPKGYLATRGLPRVMVEYLYRNPTMPGAD